MDYNRIGARGAWGLVMVAALLVLTGCTADDLDRRRKKLQDNRGFISRLIGKVIPGGGQASDGVMGGVIALMAFWANRKRKAEKAAKAEASEKDASLLMMAGAIETAADTNEVKKQLAKAQDPHVQETVRKMNADAARRTS